MSEGERPGTAAEARSVAPEPVDLEEIGHPRGTLAIVLIYGVLFALGWVALYAFEFLPRGAPTP